MNGHWIVPYTVDNYMNGIQEGHHIRTKFNFVKKIWIKCFVNPYLSGITEPYKKKLGWNIPQIAVYKIFIICPEEKSNMAAIAVHSLT